MYMFGKNNSKKKTNTNCFPQTIFLL